MDKRLLAVLSSEVFPFLARLAIHVSSDTAGSLSFCTFLQPRAIKWWQRNKGAGEDEGFAKVGLESAPRLRLN